MKQINLQIAATFTAEPIAEAIAFLLKTTAISPRIEFAPFNQIFQQLLTPDGSFAQNEDGVNILLVRLEDLASLPQERVKLQRNAQELAVAVRTATARFRVPLLLGFCPPSGLLLADEATGAWLEGIERELIAELTASKGLNIIRCHEFLAEAAGGYDNVRGQKLGSVPYTGRFYAVLAQLVSRRLYGLTSSPHKVIAVDCDQTLWTGVVGEDGPAGIQIDSHRRFLQEFLRGQVESGMLLCLASKNNESDVWELFAERQDMVLKREHILSSRINWERKSENLKSLAHELRLGLESFIFIDDDPVVCAEVEAGCPTVLTICLPTQPDRLSTFFRNHWAFDHLSITAEDSKRTAMYRENSERNQLLQESTTLEDFLKSLDLQCDVTTAGPEQLARVAQLTQRTNQFNATTIRRTEQELQSFLRDPEAGCLVVNVRDRFGDYGVVGALLYSSQGRQLEVDSFLLSCRALGRGVEHQMLSALGRAAQDKKMDCVAVRLVPTRKNLPAKDFLERTGSAFKEERNEDIIFRYPSDVARQVAYVPEVTTTSVGPPAKRVASAAAELEPDTELQTRAAGLRRIATELHRPEALTACLKPDELTRPELEVPFVAAGTEVEAGLVSIWESVLNVHPVGALDDFFELGGTSLLAVSLFVEIAERFGTELPIAALFTAPTVRSLALSIENIEQTQQWRYLVPIQPDGTKPALFCMHAAGANVLFYRDLSTHMGTDQPLYGIQAREMESTHTYLNRIEDMAAEYLVEILKFQPEGPYYLCGSSFGGLVAYEAAQQLKEKGHAIALLALFDTYGPGYPRLLPNSNPVGQKLDQVIGRFKTLKGQLRELNRKEQSDFIKAKARKAFVGAQRKWLWKKNEFQIKYNQATGRELPKDMQRNNKALRQALNSYIPKSYDGELTIFRASMQPKGIVPDPYLGWGSLAKTISLYESAGSHGAMTVDPHAKSLAEQLVPCLVNLNDAAAATDGASSVSVGSTGNQKGSGEFVSTVDKQEELLRRPA